MEYEPEQVGPMSEEAKMGIWILGAVAAVVIGMMVATGMQGAADRADAYAQATARPSGPPGLANHYTKGQFDSAVYGKTKDQIRAQFGVPGQVWDDSDTWLYFNPPVFDETAGTQVGSVAIRFEGIAGGGDQVATVSFD